MVPIYLILVYFILGWLPISMGIAVICWVRHGARMKKQYDCHGDWPIAIDYFQITSLVATYLIGVIHDMVHDTIGRGNLILLLPFIDDIDFANTICIYKSLKPA